MLRLLQQPMRKCRAFAARLLGLLRARRADADFAAELEAHVALHTEDGVRAGFTPENARRQALIKLGGAEQALQAQRERRTLPWLENFAQDLRYSLRTLRRSPGFTATAVLTLALGIGACTAIFSMVYAVLLRSLPYGDPGRLVYLFTPDPSLHLPPEIFSPTNADFFDIQRENRLYSNMSFVGQSAVNLAGQGAVERIGAARVDENFFSTLEAYPEWGRAISTGDQLQGHDHVAVISHALWQSMFAGSPDVLKDSISLDSVNYRIVGVMPPEFGYPHGTDIPYGNAEVKTTETWIPLALTPQQKADRDNASADAAIARLRPGVTIREAQSELGIIEARLDKLHMPLLQGCGALVKSFLDIVVGPVRPLMNLLLGAVILVLLIACGNTASLLLARASDRLRELGVRAALGAKRSRIARQLLTESLLIGVGGGAIGVVLAWLFLQVLPSLNPGNISRLGEASLDARVLLFAVAVSVLASVLSGILPALTVSRLDVTGLLGGSSRAIAGKHSRVQSALIVAEAAMVVVLMASAGLLIRSYINIASVSTGFSRSTVSMKISLDEHPGVTSQQQAAQRSAFFHSLIARLGALPGVSDAGAINYLPLSGSESLDTIWVDGYANRKDQLAEGRSITPDYFRAMGIPLIAGRAFTEADVSSHAHVVIVNQRFAQIYFAGRNPIGGRVGGDNRHWDTVVGVVADVRHFSLEEAPEPQFYHPDYGGFDSAYIAVRSTLPSRTVAAEARAVVRTIDPSVAVADVHTMGELESEASAQRRFQTTLLTLFAGVALLLALAGIFGLMSYSVSRREREVGIRMALGAQRGDVMLLVLGNAALLLGLGLTIGFGCAWFAVGVMKSFLFEVGGHDPLTLCIACVLLAMFGLLAAIVPARRAASVDPMQALRAE